MAETLLQSGGQLYAVSGRRPRIDLAEAVRASVPNLYARKAFEQDAARLRLEEEAQRRAGTQQTIGNVLSGTGTLIQAGQLAKATGLLGGSGGLFGGSAAAAPAVSAAPAIGVEAGLVAGAEIAAPVATGAILGPTAAEAGALVATEAGAGAGGGAVGGAGGAAAGGVGASGAAAGAAVVGVASAAGGYGGGKFVRGLGARGTTGGLTGAAAGGVIGFAIGGFAGAAVGALAGGLSGAGICILVTCCHGRDSEEVALARRYRDMYLDAVDLRGYYAVGEPMVCEMQNNPRYTDEVRTELVEPLLKWGAFVLGESEEPPSEEEAWKAGAFLRHIRAVGELMESYVRSNGEVV